MGTAGHMQHPFDIPSVKTGQDLINYFERIAEHLSTNPGSVKFDGINVSFKLVDDESSPVGKDFRMDRGNSEPSSVLGMTTADAYEKWEEGHGMPPAIEELLAIFNEALPQITPELKKLGLWDDPTKYINTEYMKKGKTNVIEYDEKILALHSINQFYEKKAQPWRIKQGIGMDRPGLERPIDPDTGKPNMDHDSVETAYDPGALQSIIEKVKPIAEQHEVSLVGDVPTELSADVDFSETLATPLTIQITETESKTFSLGDWLTGKGGEVKNPFDAKVQTKDSGKPWAISKEVYFAVLNGTPLMEWLENPEDVELAIDGALFNYATHHLGMDVKSASTSSKGGLEGHEGIVIRGFDNRPLKVTGDFIVKGSGGEIKKKLSAEEEIVQEAVEEPIDLEFEEDSEVEKTNIAVYPGRFQPMGQHHAEVFKKLEADGGFDKIYIATSDKTDSTEVDGIPKSPFSFEEKKQIMMAHGIPEEKIISVKNPYNAVEILQNYEPEDVSITYFVGEKDMKEDPRFQKINGTTKEGYDWAITTAPHVSIEIPEVGEMSGTNIRKALKGSEPESFEHIMGWYDPILYDLIKTRLRQLEESQQPLGIFLRLIEETLDEAPLTQMYGTWAGNLADITPPGTALEEAEESDDEGSEEQSINYKPSTVHGTGAFSSNGHKKDVILGLALKKLDTTDLHKNYNTFHNLGDGAPANLVVGISKVPKQEKGDYAIGSTDGGKTWYSQTDLGNYVNHSPDPNVVFIQMGDDLHMKTIQDITPGCELTMDYRDSLSPVKAHPTEEWDRRALEDKSDTEELEEISAMGAAPGGGKVEGYAKQLEEEEDGLIREVEDYLFSALGVNS